MWPASCVLQTPVFQPQVNALRQRRSTAGARPAEQRRRFEAEMQEKSRVYGETYPLDEDFLEALEAMPEASGIALGFDRLVMLATGALRIDQVIWAPVAETHLG